MSYWVEGSKVHGPMKGIPAGILVADCTGAPEPEKTARFIQTLLNDHYSRLKYPPVPFPASIDHIND